MPKNTPSTAGARTHQVTPASLGNISTATLRTEDLLKAFGDELEWQIRKNGDYFSQPENFDERDRLNNLVGEAQDCFAENGEGIDPDKEDEASELVNETLPDALQTFAPPYCSFGAHEGDGADFGYWPDWSAIEDLPTIADNTPEAIAAEQSDEYSTDVRYVNDHGNVTVYGADGSVLLELV